MRSVSSATGCARFLNTSLLGNHYDCHALVELYLPGSDRYYEPVRMPAKAEGA